VTRGFNEKRELSGIVRIHLFRFFTHWNNIISWLKSW